MAMLDVTVHCGGTLSMNLDASGNSTMIEASEEKKENDPERQAEKDDNKITQRNIKMEQHFTIRIDVSPEEEAYLERLLCDFIQKNAPEDSYRNSRWEQDPVTFSYLPSPDRDQDTQILHSRTNIPSNVLQMGIQEISTELEANRGVGKKLEAFIKDVKTKTQPLTQKLEKMATVMTEKFAGSALGKLSQRLPVVGEHIAKIDRAVRERERAANIIKKHIAQSQNRNRNVSRETIPKKQKDVRDRIEANKKALEKNKELVSKLPLTDEQKLRQVREKQKQAIKERDSLKQRLLQKENYLRQLSQVALKIENVLGKERGDIDRER